MDTLHLPAHADPISHHAAELTHAIISTLFKHLDERDYSVRLWDGQIFPAVHGPQPNFTLVLNHPGALRRMFLPPGELTLAEAYLHGDFDIDGDIIAAISLAMALEALTPKDWLGLVRRLRMLPKTEPPTIVPGDRQPARLRGRRHSRQRDQAAVSYHYDVGNDFYRLFLGLWMAYSCAYFPTRTTDLDSAQAAKFEHICRKLRLQPGERLLDIGCGWGGLVIYAAQHYGVQATGVTLSHPQVEFGQNWIRQTGLEKQVNIELRDYRELDHRTVQFDKIASVGMFEHVGRAKLREYFQDTFRILRSGGLFLNHGIALQDEQPSTWVGRTLLYRGQFIERYIFPDGELVPVSETLATAEKVGFEVRDMESLREHYALTLRHWINNLEEQQTRAAHIADERTYRTWRLYMAASAQGFERAYINVYQTLLSKSDQGSANVPLTRADLYTTDNAVQ